jgi:hypothetical protein
VPLLLSQKKYESIGLLLLSCLDWMDAVDQELHTTESLKKAETLCKAFQKRFKDLSSELGKSITFPKLMSITRIYHVQTRTEHTFVSYWSSAVVPGQPLRPHQRLTGV